MGTHHTGDHGDVDEDVHAQHGRRRAVDAQPLARRLHGALSAIGAAVHSLPLATQVVRWGTHAPRAIGGYADVKVLVLARRNTAPGRRPACRPHYHPSLAGDSGVCPCRAEGKGGGGGVSWRVCFARRRADRLAEGLVVASRASRQQCLAVCDSLQHPLGLVANAGHLWTHY